MANDGSFPLETARTKPYGYSLFNLDAMAAICQLLSTPTDNLWTYTTAANLSMKKGIHYLVPYLRQKDKWPFAKDVMYWEQWPVAQPFLFLGAIAYHDAVLLDTWVGLDHSPTHNEVIRNLPLRYPLLWL